MTEFAKLQNLADGELLSDRSVILVGGADARDLLQRVVSAYLETLDKDTLRSCALLTPQG